MISSALRQASLSIAVYRSSSIGDVVLASACLELIKQLAIPTKVYWLGREPSLGLIASAYPDVIPVEIKKDETIRAETIAQHIEGPLHIVVNLQKNFRSRVLCAGLARLKKASYHTWNKQGMRRGTLVAKARLLGRSRSLSPQLFHDIPKQYAMMLEPLKVALEEQLPAEYRDVINHHHAPRLPTAHDEERRAWQKELKFGKWLAVAPGAAHPTKQAPTAVFLEILNDLRSRAQEDIGLVFLGDENDRLTAVELMDQLKWSCSTLNLAGKLSLWESALALRSTQALLANDSSLGHIAEAVGTSVAVLFGPTIETFGFAPHRETSRAFSTQLGCRPCSKHGKTKCRFGDQLCFTDIPATDVGSFLNQLCQKARSDHGS